MYGIELCVLIKFRLTLPHDGFFWRISTHHLIVGIPDMVPSWKMGLPWNANFGPVVRHFSCASLQKEPPFAELFFSFSCKETSNSGLVSNVCYYIVKVILLRPHVNQKDAAHSFSFSRKNHLFFSVPKISELLKPSRIKESVYWGEETMEQIKKRLAGIYWSPSFCDVAKSLMSSKNQYFSPVLF